MDDLLLSPGERALFISALASLVSEGVRAHGLWGGAIAEALAALVGADSGVLVLQCGPVAFAFGPGISGEMLRSVGRAPATLSAAPDDLIPVRTRAWCREAPSPGTATSNGRAPVDQAAPHRRYEAVGLTANLRVEGGGRASLACHFHAPRSGTDTQRSVEMLRLLLPAFEATARERLIALTVARRSREQVAAEMPTTPTRPRRPSLRVLREKCGLTPREVEVAHHLMTGRSNAAIADSLGISPYTARHHTERVLDKLGVRSRAEVPGTVHELVRGA
jgi:DNA-binding CsgD family transcriptional regulator